VHSPAHMHLESWSFSVPLTLALILVAFLYSRGWLRLRRAVPNAISFWQLGAFMSGLFSLWVALGSPLAAFDHYLLSIHMIEHVLLMAVAPPLILLGAPVLVFLNGLPQRFVCLAQDLIRRWPLVQGLGRILTHPVLCWLAAMVALIGWHVPAVFALALRSHSWHEVEYTSFFVTGLLFWWPVVQPWPSVARWPRWCIPLYLFLATLPCDVLSAFLAFCDRVVYSSYLTAPRRFNISPLQDQQCAGALMWVCATFIYLIPAVVVIMQVLSPPRIYPAEQPKPPCPESPGGPLAADVEVS
jgi:putative membrane protein